MNQPAFEQSQNDFSDLPVGEILRRTRLHYNRTIEEVEAALRIQGKQLHAIEVGDTESLPARVYAIGFVRSYAEYLGLDGEKIVSLFKAQSEPETPEPALKFAESKPASEAPPVGVAVALFVLLCVVLVTVFSFGGSSTQKAVEQEIIPEVPKELTVAALEEKQAAIVKKPAPEPKPVVEKPKGIVLKMLQNSWVEIRDENGRKLISRVLNAGDQYFVPERLGLSMSIGNAGGVEILVDGDSLDGLGKKGQVLRNIPLKAEALLKRFPKAQNTPIENVDKNQ